MKPVFALIAVVVAQSMNHAFSVPVTNIEPLDLVERGCRDKRNDCHWIADHHYDIQKYCWAHRHDAFIKDCPKYCGFCGKQPAPAQVWLAECKDKRDDCHWIADNHFDIPKYCRAHRNDAFIKDCPRYCGFCGKQPAPAQVWLAECKDKRDDCHWIADNHFDIPKYCRAHRNDAFIKDCPRYCGFCGKPPAPVEAFTVCEDTRSDCDWINHNGENKETYCFRNRNDPGVRKCAKTCGFCKVPAPQGVVISSACVDTRDDCSWIGEHNDDVAAYCDRHRNDAFIKQCQQTCGYCKPPAPARVCQDTRSDCDTINHIGEPKASYCARNRHDAAVSQCPKTCGFC